MKTKTKQFKMALITMGIFIVFSGCAPSSDSVVSKCALLLKNSDYAGAVSIADTGIGQGTYDKALLRLRGIARLGGGEYEEAISDLKASLALSNGLVDASDIDTSYYLAVAEYKSGDCDAADVTLSAITDIRPKEDRAFFLRGKVRLSEGKKDEAIGDFDRAVSLAATNYDYYVEIFEELTGSGYKEEGSVYLEKAMSYGNKLSDYNKGVLEYHMGSYTDARNDLENARKKNENENVILYLGKTYEALGDPGYAQSIYEGFLQTQSRCGKIYEALAYLKMNQKDYEGALATIETGLEMGGNEGVRSMMFNRIVAYERIFDFDKAKEAMDEYLAKYPGDVAAIRENVFLSSR